MPFSSKQYGPKEITVENAVMRMMRLIAKREYTEHQIRKKLTTLGLSKEQQETVCKQLKNENAINDKRFTEVFIRMQKLQHNGPRKITFQLQRRGVSLEIVTKQLETQYIATEQDKIAKAALRKRELQKGKEEYEKQARFLSNKGFTEETIYSILK